MSYKTVIFDLDHTLWDYETNSREALEDLYHRYDLPHKSKSDFSDFYNTFVEINTRLWDRYDRGEISREVIRFERFHQVFQRVGIDQYELSLTFSHDYVTESPSKNRLMPQALETLNYLKRRYRLYIITNGFEEIQSTKMKASGIAHFFDAVITSEKAGYKKPSPEIFRLALNHSEAQPFEAVMIGDNLLTDIAGGRNADIDTVYFNPNQLPHQERVTHEIKNLYELTSIL
jgi:YjjG family noncanonical pyrimidine nucleotidase